MAKVFFICGRVGAGKTTYSNQLVAQEKATHFNIDDWMVTLFGADAPNPLNLEWALPRTQRCNEQIWKISKQLVSLNVNVILDLGFYRKEQREAFRLLAENAGIPFEFHFIDVPAEMRRLRVQARNQGSETKTVEVSDEMFNWAENWFEDLDTEELKTAVVSKN
jgi:predicted kinase